MSLKQHFCSSPWFHMGINNAGGYEYCRWASKNNPNNSDTLANLTPAEFFQKRMISIRKQMLDGQPPPDCSECYQMEKHSKVSGRQRQLLKVGVLTDQFEKTMASSPWMTEFALDGMTSQLPQDWQINLGNYCDSACVFCTPFFSSRLASEFKKIGIAHQHPTANWANDPKQLETLIDSLRQSPNIAYIHFIGGETLITPAFKTVLQALIAAGLNQQATIGFTTNLGSWREDVVELLAKFHSVNLGMSIESFHPVNEYVRYPAQQATVNTHLDKWLAVAKQHNWYKQLRITPTALSIKHLTGIYDYAWQNHIAVESCNFLEEPAFLRPSVLPLELRAEIIQSFKHWIEQHGHMGVDTVINGRDPNQSRNFIVQELQSYVNYLEAEADESWRLPDLVQYLKKLEANRKNSILDYLPEYEELFRSAGY